MQSTSYDFVKSYGTFVAIVEKYAGKELKIPWLIAGKLPEDGSIHTLGESYVDIDTAQKLTLCNANRSRVSRGVGLSDRETIPLIFFLDSISADIRKAVAASKKPPNGAIYGMSGKLKYPLILASSSPRRSEILNNIGLEFDIETADVDEFTRLKRPSKIVEELSYRKARVIFEKHPDSIVIGADTIVSIEGQVLGKPKDKEDALRMLKILSGNTHDVYTGVSVLSPESENTFFERTKVTMLECDEAFLIDYIETGEPMDKAGSYGIQEKGAVLIDKIDGNYHNVVGLPIARLYEVLRQWS